MYKYYIEIIETSMVPLSPYRPLARLTMTDPALRAEFLVAGPDGVPVGLPCRQAPPPGVALLAEGLAGGGDGVERDDVAEGSDVRIADQR